MAQRKLQISLSEEEYLYLKQAAGERGSMTGVVRSLIHSAGRPGDPHDDPFYSHVVREQPAGGVAYDAERAKRDLYRRPR